MTQDRIIEMAREADILTIDHHYLERFATLVRAATLEEAAGVCDELNQGLRIQPTRDEFTAAIRALKETK